MGCGGSSQPRPAPAPAPAPATLLQPENQYKQAAPASGKAKSKGKGKGNGKGKGRANGKFVKDAKWQIQLSGNYQDYEPQEDAILKRAFLMGQPNCRFHLRGQDYEYNFKSMKQKNLGSGKERQIRAPMGMRPPPAPVLPQGPVSVVTIQHGQAGQQIQVNDPNNPGRQVPVMVPPNARPGQKMAIPLPEKGQDVQAVQQKQLGMSVGGKIAGAGALVAGAGVVAVGGAILGDYLMHDGEGVEAVAGDISDWAAGDGADMAGDVADWAQDAYGDAADWVAGDGMDYAADAGEWVEGAYGDAADWAEGAYGDAADWAAGDGADLAADVGDWLGDAAEDAGDFVMNLF
jgi:hypothetical protein